MPQIYRDIQIGSVWEGSGNVSALDVLRAAAQEPEGLSAFLDECELALGADPRLDEHLLELRSALGATARKELALGARRLVEDLGVALQASLLVRHAPREVADGFCASRLGGGGKAFGTLPAGLDLEAIVERSLN